MKPRGCTIVEKIAASHMTEGPEDRPLRTGDTVSIRPRHIMTHDNTAAVMKKFQAIGARCVRDPQQPVFILDHDIQNRSPENLAKYASIEEFASLHGIDFHPAGSGIGHQIMCEQLYAVPGSFVVGSDSHSNMYGALGAVGTPVVRTDAAAIWATGEFWWSIPRSIRVILEGELPEGASGKDVIVALCGRYNKEEVLNAAVEFSGPGVGSLSMDARMTIANMTTEWGALVGWFPIDKTTIRYVRHRAKILSDRSISRFEGGRLQQWQVDPPRPDDDAVYAATITLDLSTVTPHVSGPDSVQVMTPLGTMQHEKIAIQKAYLISCVNSRLEDLEASARVLSGRKVAEGVEFYVAAASREVQEEAEKSGVWSTLIDAGARALPPGCGPCIGLGTGTLEPGEVGISATNRNFKGRMGSREARCYLGSPAVVAASAAAGYIRAPEPVELVPLSTAIELHGASSVPTERTAILEGFPRSVSGRLVYLPLANLNTDGIYGKDYTYREDMTPEMMARVVMENYDPEFAGLTRSGDILVGDRNFGTGSSREQAVTALQAKGIAMVIAASFSQTYLRNAFNNGFTCIESPAFIDRVRSALADQASKSKTIVTGEEIRVDFEAGTITFRGEESSFPPLGSVPQALVIDEGIENQVRRKLGLDNHSETEQK